MKLKRAIGATSLGALSGLLLLFSFPPHGNGFLAFFALVPLLTAISNTRSAPVSTLSGLTAGLCLFFPVLHWLSYVTVAGYVLCAVYCALYLALFGFLCHDLYRRFATPWPFASVWIMLELLRSYVLGGFAWFFLGHTQHNFHLLIQIADLVGVLGISALVFVINVLIFLALKDCVLQSRWKLAFSRILLIAALLSAAAAYGIYRTETLPVKRILKVAIVQGNVPQEVKETFTGRYSPEAVVSQYLELSGRLSEADGVDLLVWPETVVLPPFAIEDSEVSNLATSTESKFLRHRLDQLASALDSHLLIGSLAVVQSAAGQLKSVPDQRDGGRKWRVLNSAYLLDRNGRFLGRYDKRNLVPFGEYIPFERFLPVLRRLVPFTESLTVGERDGLLSMTKSGDPIRFGVVICYEDTNARLTAGLRAKGAEFIVNISNDAWFRVSGELEQHFSAAVFRAIENRVGVVRGGNNGITGIIDPLGAVQYLNAPGTDGELRRKGVPGILVGEVTSSTSQTIYTTCGDWPAIAWAVLLVLWAAFRSRNRAGRVRNGKDDGEGSSPLQALPNQ